MNKKIKLGEIMKEEKNIDRELQMNSGGDKYLRELNEEKERAKKAKDKLAYYKKVIADSNDAIVIQDFNGVVKAWNSGAEQIYGFKAKEMIGKNITKIIAKEYREAARKNIEAVKKGKPTFKVNQMRITKDHQKISLWITYSPIYEDEEIIEIATTEQDITKSLKSIEDLRLSEERYRNMIEDSADAIFIADPKTRRLVDCNKAAIELTGYSKKELCKMKADDLHPKKILKETMEEFAKQVKGEEIIVETEILKKDKKTRVPVSINASLIKVGEKILIQGIFRNITERKKIEKALNESEEKYRTLAERSNDGIALVQRGKIIYSNSKLLEMSCYSIEDVINKSFVKFFIREEKRKVTKSYNLRMKGKKIPEIYESVIQGKNGEEINIEINAGIIQYKNKPADLILIRDITERKNAEREMIREKELSQKYLDLAGVMILGLDLKGKINLINKKGAEILEGKQEEILGKNWFSNFLPTKMKDEVKKIFSRLMDGKNHKIMDYENLVLTKKGNKKLISWYNTIIKNEVGDVVGILSSGEDITERKKAEEEILSYKQGFDNSPNSEFLIEYVKGKPQIVHVNEGFEDYYGYSEKEVLGKNPNIIQSGKQSKKYYQKMWENILNPKIGFWRGEVINKRKDGSFINVILTISSIFDENKKPIKFTSSHIDITGEKLAEERLKKSEEKYRILTEKSPDCIKILDSKGRVLFMNKSGIKEHYLKEKNLEKFDYFKVIGKESKKEFKNALKQSFNGKDSTIKISHDPKFSKRKMSLITISPIKDSNDQINNVFVVSRDITGIERARIDLEELNLGLEKKIEERTSELKESEEQYKSLYHFSKDAIMVLEPPSWKFTGGNPAAIKIFGMEDEKEFMLKTPFNLSPRYQPDGALSKIKAFKMIKIAMKKGSNFFEWVHKKSTGEEFPCTVLLTRMKIKGEDILQATVRDITEEKRILDELQKANEEFKQIDVLKTDFFNMVSHELKTPLTAMSAHLEILQDKNSGCFDKNKGSCNQSLGAIKRNNDQLKTLINNLLEISRIQSKTFELNIEKLDSSKLALTVIDNLKVLAEQKGLKIITKLGKVPKIAVDEVRFEEIFNNLIGNAIKFTEKGYIKIKNRKKGKFVVFDIIDTGIGMKPEQLLHLFEKFYQEGDVSRKHSGTGLGLPITKQLLELQGGTIEVKSVYKKGSTFTIKFPIKYTQSEKYIALGKERNWREKGKIIGGEKIAGVKGVKKEKIVGGEISKSLERENEIVDAIFEKTKEKNSSKKLKGGVNNVRKKI